MNLLKQELRVHGKEVLFLLAVQVAAWFLGIGMVCLILAIEPSDTYFSMGMVFALACAAIVGLAYDGFTYQTRFQLAISMGRSRRGQLLVHVVMAFARLMLFVGIAWMLGKAESAFYARLYPLLCNETDLFVIYRVQYILPIAAAVVVVGLFIAAINGRYGRKGGLILYFCCLGFYLLCMRLADLRPDSFLMRFFDTVFDFLPGAMWIVLAVLAAIALVVYSLRVLLRQQVQF